MAAPQSGVAVAWATTADVYEPAARPPNGTDPKVDDVTMAKWLLIASDCLFERTGRRWAGQVSGITVRPAPRAYGDGSPVPRFGSSGSGSLGSFDYRYGGGGSGGVFAYRITGVPLSRNGAGAGISEITLGVYPLISVEAVKIDGVLLVAGTDYRVDDYRWLVRLGGAGWPVAQRMDLPDTAVGTFSVTLTGGMAPPRMGVAACAALGSELALAASNDSTCRLPRRTQSVARQGVNANFIDPATLFPEGLTGIPEADLFLTTYNPQKIRRRATVHSTDQPRSVRRITG